MQQHLTKDNDKISNSITKHNQQQHLHINWLNFKPEFSGKPEEDAEAQLLHSSDWMNAHHFVNGVKVQRFCLTLLGEAIIIFGTFRQYDMAGVAKFV